MRHRSERAQKCSPLVREHWRAAQEGACVRHCLSDQWRSNGSLSKRLEKGRFVWPSAKEGKIALTPAQLAMLLEGIDWRLPLRTWRPLTAG